MTVIFNGEGFLTPYIGHLYHLREWDNAPHQPHTAEEYFNLKHAKSRNVIERCFGLLKGRWGILRSPSWFNLQTHGRIVLACALLHNLVKRYMPPRSFNDNKLYEEVDSDNEEAFPHFHDLTSIYGTDYATGKLAEGFVDAVNNMEKTTPTQVTFDSSDDEEDIASGNVSQTIESEAPPSKKAKIDKTSSKKGGRKPVAAAGSEISNLQSFMKDMNVHLFAMDNVMPRDDEREQKLVEKK
ncbi:hypothetical protein POM88_046939 [Heracleum sosnowskyi]|uniref:DDE Tnp4 domain-containing protein n=1 Tax=Heracleum sosnowskyi TaxID=360622 RepID=A0AAD8H7T5_9APIA|nr:hypothetical protein POM88_046939 [Heracleum sosnowskyi]